MLTWYHVFDRFGLYHTFATMYGDECNEIDQETYGDFIDDTPVMSGPSNFVLAEQGEDCTDYLTGQPPDTCTNLQGG